MRPRSIALLAAVPFTLIAAGWLTSPPPPAKTRAKISTKGERVTVKISPTQGGRLAAADGKATVAVRPHAVSEETTFTAQQVTGYTDRKLRSHSYALGPGGRFAKPVEVCLEQRGDDKSDSLCLGFFNDASDQWECEDACLEKKGGLLCGSTDHFTNFALLLSGGSSKGGQCDDDDDDDERQILEVPAPRRR